MAKKLSDQTRAAIIASLLEGQAVTKVADDYKVDKATVSRLKKVLPAEALQQIATKKENEFAALISANLKGSFEAIQNILNQTKDADWLRKQSAAELATLLGVTSDKVFRVLEAIENAQADADKPDEWPETVR